MALATGCAQLDRMLGGGFPEQRAVLVTGGPGVGKSTLAMQFLQEGLANDERCLYVSTEQTTDELRTSFAPFEFSLDHPNLTITSIHAMPESTIEESESGLALHTLTGDQSIDGPFHYPFESEYIHEYLSQFAPCERVVLDSASGLAAISDDRDRFRRVILDLIRLFTDTFGATTIFTAEEVGSEAEHDSPTSIGTSDLLQFSTHGVIRLWWEELRGSRHRFLQIVKMRGVDHQTRRYEVSFSAEGLVLAPESRTTGVGIEDDAIISTGIEGLDELCGGLVRGHSVLVEYDGRAMVDNFVAHMLHNTLEKGMSVWFFPSPIMSAGRVANLMPGDWDIQRLLDDNVLFVLDGFGAWKAHHDHRNVFYAPQGVLGNLFRRSKGISMYLMKRMAQKITARRVEAPMVGLVYTEAFLRWLDPSEVKEVYYWAREELATEYDTGFWVHNPATMDPQLAEFFHSDAVQVFETRMEENGIQYLRLTKSPIGQPGQSAVIDFDEQGIVLGPN